MSEAAVEPRDIEELLKRSKKKANRSFWTTLLIIIAVLTSLLTAAPQWYDSIAAYTAGIEGGSLAEAKRQNALWQKNLTCYAMPAKSTATENGLHVSARVCDSGDVLINVRRADNREFYRWVPVDSIVQRDGDTQAGDLE